MVTAILSFLFLIAFLVVGMRIVFTVKEWICEDEED